MLRNAAERLMPWTGRRRLHAHGVSGVVSWHAAALILPLVPYQAFSVQG